MEILKTKIRARLNVVVDLDLMDVLRYELDHQSEGDECIGVGVYILEGMIEESEDEPPETENGKVALKFAQDIIEKINGMDDVDILDIDIELD